MKRIASLLFLGATALVFVVRCSEPVHECGKDINCGDPGGLSGVTAPGPPNAAGQDSNNTKTTPGTDSGVSSLCTPMVVTDGGNCGGISFTADILGKKFGAAGAWGCAASGCHDPQGGTPPKIDVADPATTYKNLYNSGSGSAPYINPCSTDPTKSEILENLKSPSTLGQHMPLGNVNLPTQADIDSVIKPWVLCGAPLN
jgi:hypothetical protein